MDKKLLTVIKSKTNLDNSLSKTYAYLLSKEGPMDNTIWIYRLSLVERSVVDRYLSVGFTALKYYKDKVLIVNTFSIKESTFNLIKEAYDSNKD